MTDPAQALMTMQSCPDAQALMTCSLSFPSPARCSSMPGAARTARGPVRRPARPRPRSSRRCGTPRARAACRSGCSRACRRPRTAAPAVCQAGLPGVLHHLLLSLAQLRHAGVSCPKRSLAGCMYVQGNTDPNFPSVRRPRMLAGFVLLPSAWELRSCQRCQHLIVVREFVKLPPPRVPQLGEAVQEQHQRLALPAARGDSVEPASRGHGEHGAHVSHALGAADHRQPPAPETCRAEVLMLW